MRWTIRVVAYAALMTDEYPPFRLDQGGGTAPQVDGSPAPVASQSRASTGSTGSIVAGVVSLSVAGLLLLGAGSFIAAQHAMPDDDGFFMTPGWSVNESTYAITSESINIPSNTLGGMAPDAALGDGRITVESMNGVPMFVGVARTSDVRSYLDGVASSTVTSMMMKDHRSMPTYRHSSGGAPGVMPRHSNIWIAHSESSGLQSLTWPMHSGDWTVVVMRSDGDQGIAADVEAGATLPAVGWIVTGLLVGTGVFLLIGLAFLIGGLKSRTPRSVTVRP